MTPLVAPNPRPMSASQATLLQRCPREYIFKYTLRYPEEKTEALFMGLAFHKVMETGELSDDAFQGLDENKYPYRAAVEKMARAARSILHTLPETVSIERGFESTTDKFGTVKGIPDRITMQPNGRWKILDWKTCGKFDPLKFALVTSDVQMNNYVAHKDQIAEVCDLLPEKFDGVTYVEIRKPTERKKVSETLEQFAQRMTIETRVLEFSPLDFARAEILTKATFDMAFGLREYAESIYNKSKDTNQVPGNNTACIRYGKPCSFFQHCHGMEAARIANTTTDTGGA